MYERRRRKGHLQSGRRRRDIRPCTPSSAGFWSDISSAASPSPSSRSRCVFRAGQVSSGGSDPQNCTVCLAEQSLLFHAGGGGYVTHFMELLTWLWVCVDSGHLNHSMRDEKQSVHQKLDSGSVEGFLIWLALDLIVPVWSEKKFKILTLLCYVHCCISQHGSLVFPQDENHYKT